jgi:predicted RNase H-like HicB family nuclease
MEALAVKSFTAVVERCPDTGLYVGYVPGFPGAHTQAETLDELNNNLREVIEMLLGFRRAGPAIQRAFKSAISGAIRQGLLERDGGRIRAVR